MSFLVSQILFPMRLSPAYLWGLGQLTILLSVWGCSPSSSQRSFLPLQLAHPPVMPVSIENIPEQDTPSVYLQGQVTSQIPLVNSGLYQLQDPSGDIWILTQEPLPPLHHQVSLRGQIHYEPILIDGQDRGEHYVKELERLSETAPPQSSTR